MIKLPGTTKIILASKSPRRQELLGALVADFEVATREVDESFPPGLSPVDAVRYIAEKKAKAFGDVVEDTLVITADTIVVAHNQVLGKPVDRTDAHRIIRLLSGISHEVITAVAFLYHGKITLFHEITTVYFRPLSEADIWFYIDGYKPFDKAGAYGIQEWIGLVAVQKILGSYTNVVGLPTERVYRELQKMFPDTDWISGAAHR